jgi:type I restriction enzyme S subunit
LVRSNARNAKALPDGWVLTTLEQVCLPPQYGWTTSASKEGTLRFLRTSDITSGDVDWASVPFCRDEPPNPEKYLLHDGDIVISRAGSVGYSFLVRNPQCAVFASYLIRFRPLVDDRYVAYFLQTASYWRAISEKKLGIAVPNVNATKLKQIFIPLAPLSEQHRIVAEIETQFTRLDAGVAALKRAQANLWRYKASVLKAACEGRLVPTEAELARAEGRDYEPADVLLKRILAERRAKWEAENPGKKYKEPKRPETSKLSALPEGWVWATIEQCVRIIDYRGRTPPYSDEGIPHLRTSNIRNGRVIWDDLRYVSEETYQRYMTRGLPQVGDLLFTTEAPLGEVAFAPERRFSLAQRMMILRPAKGLVSSGFLKCQLMSSGFQQMIRYRETGSTVTGISSRNFRPSPVRVPPLEEQHRIVAEVERRLSVVEGLEKQVETALKRAERLRQAVLKHGFEGELVPQDPNDEPASVLLERIKAERDGQVGKGGRRVSKKPRAKDVTPEQLKLL